MQFSTLQSTTPSSNWKNITESSLIKTGDGVAVGILINSHTSGTIKVYADTEGSVDAITGTITLATSGTYDRWIPLFGARFNTGLYVEVGNTVNATVFYN